MKTKLDLADGFVLKVIGSGCSFDLGELVSQAWQYADAMHAEAEKREPQGLPDVLKDGFSHGGYVEPQAHSLVGVVGDSNGSNSSQLDWQPDWSQAPSNYNWYAMDESREHGFFHLEPQIVPHCKTWFMGDFDTKYFHKLDDFSCTYFGNWQDSLRKRP